jgi:hypothetical protein
MQKALDITLSYQRKGIRTVAIYRLSEETFHSMQSWKAKTAHPTDRALSDWLGAHGGKRHCENGPAVVERKADGSIFEMYYIDGVQHRADGPAIVERKADGSTYEAYYINDKCHRVGSPALLWRYADGSTCEEYYIDGMLHRPDGPAVVKRGADGLTTFEKYYIGGKCHRMDGPAIVQRNPDGSIAYESYYIDDKSVASLPITSDVKRRPSTPPPSPYRPSGSYSGPFRGSDDWGPGYS